MKKYLAFGLAGLTAISVAACGTTTTASTVAGKATPSTTTTVKPPPPQPQPLTLTAPSGDHVTSATYTLKGTATVGSSVLVNSEKVSNHRGHWSKVVHLHHGDNGFSIKVMKPNHQSVVDDVTITRDLTAAEREAQRQAAARRKAQAEAAAAARKAQAEAAAAARTAQEEANYKGRAITIPYNQLNKDADGQAGKIVTYTGQIFQIQRNDTEDGWVILVSVTNDGYGVWGDHIWVDYNGNVKGAEGDMVTFWGKVDGSKSYETQIGGETYVPEVTAKYLNG
jgi:hypothetical protein